MIIENLDEIPDEHVSGMIAQLGVDMSDRLDEIGILREQVRKAEKWNCRRRKRIAECEKELKALGGYRGTSGFNEWEKRYFERQKPQETEENRN